MHQGGKILLDFTALKGETRLEHSHKPLVLEPVLKDL